MVTQTDMNIVERHQLQHALLIFTRQHVVFAAAENGYKQKVERKGSWIKKL